MKKIKADLLKKMFSHADSRRIITWRFNEMLKNNENSGNNNYKNVWSFKAIKKNFGKQSKIGNINQSALNDNFGRAFKLNNSREGSKGIRSEVDNRFNPSEISKKSKRASVPYEGEKQFGVNELNEKINEINMDVPNMSSANNVSSKNNNILPFGQSLFHKFVLSVTDVKFGETKIGHIFRFEVFDPSKTYSDISNIGTKVSTKFGLTKPPTIKDKTELMSSDISLMSFSPNMAKPAAPQVLFNVTNENPNGINLGLDNTFIPVLDPENEFYIDGDKLSFKQRGKNEDFKKEIEREKLRQKAQDKILKAKISKDDEEEEEEEESSSYEEDDNESKENSEKISIKENNENKSYFSDKEGPLSIDKITPIQEKSEKENKIVEHQTHKTEVKAHAKHNKEDDFYQVDTSKIIFKVYNFTSGYVTEVKDPKFKISKVTHCLNKEREKLSKMSKFITNPKTAKEKKKGASTSSKQIMDDEELEAYSKKKIKLKEIQKALASKEKQASIINLCIFSFIIFFIIILSSVASILLNSYFYNQISIYYNLIEKSVTLYRNLIFEINFVREMILLNHPNYKNFYDNDIMEYYKNYSETCYQYYVETAFVLSNLSTTLNSLTEETRQKTAEREGTLVLIDPTKTANGSYFTKQYNLKIYSAFHELNAALYHVSQMNVSDIITYDDNVYYFTMNSMNTMLTLSEEQIDIFTDEFYNEINKVHKFIIICICAVIIIYGINFFIFIYFYQKVEERKQSYLSVFYEIGSSFIVTSLAKCEKFSQRIQLQDDMMGAGEKVSFGTSTEDSDLDNDIGSISSLGKIKNNVNNSAGKARNVKKNSNLKMKIGGFIVIFILLCVQIFSYGFYYIRNTLYEHYVEYEYYNNKYNSRFLFPFIALREYLYDQKKTLLNEEVDQYLEKSLTEFYKDLAEISNQRDLYTQYLPTSYTVFIDELFRDNQCKFINVFIAENHTNFEYDECEQFFYSTSTYGFQAVLTTYIEEIRIMRDLQKYYLENAALYNFTYNESLIGTQYEDYLYPKDEEELRLYQLYNPVLILNETTHKNAIIIYRFVVMKIVQSALDNLFDAIHLAFDNTTTISYIINIAFMVVCVLGFFMFWLPFVLGENDTIYKTKNMLSIIPNEVLFTLPHINIMLGIDEEGN